MNLASLRVAISAWRLRFHQRQPAWRVWPRNHGEPVSQAACVNARPAVITQTPVAAQRQPIDPYAPPAHSKQLVAL